MRILFLIILLLPTFCLSQNKKLYDTSFVLGLVQKDVMPTIEGPRFISIAAGTRVVVYDITMIGSKHRGYVVVYGSNKFTLSDEEVKVYPLDAYDQLLDFTPEQMKIFQSTALNYGLASYQLDLDEVSKYFKKQSSIGLIIDDWGFHDESEYTDGTGLTLKITNLSKKTIKYIWFTVTAKNPVKDIISTKTVKGVGPVKPDSGGSWEFDYVWFTDLVSFVNIRSIKVQYMDGTYKTYSNIESLFIPDKYSSILKNIDVE